jgi:hypothetical protein
MLWCNLNRQHANCDAFLAVATALRHWANSFGISVWWYSYDVFALSWLPLGSSFGTAVSAFSVSVHLKIITKTETDRNCRLFLLTIVHIISDIIFTCIVNVITLTYCLYIGGFKYLRSIFFSTSSNRRLATSRIMAWFGFKPPGGAFCTSSRLESSVAFVGIL